MEKQQHNTYRGLIFTKPTLMIPIDNVMDSMPKVGDVLKKVPLAHRYGNVGGFYGIDLKKPIDCVVTYVNKENLWYQVEFTFGSKKYKECFKCPETRGVYFETSDGVCGYCDCEKIKGDYFTTGRYYNE